MGQKFRCVPF